MNTLFRPVPIETTEQADALPTGTVIQCTAGPLLGVAPLRKTDAGAWFGGSGLRVSQDLRIGASEGIRCEWTALVPVEVEEEGQALVECEIGVPGSERITRRRRLVTPWEATR